MFSDKVVALCPNETVTLDVPPVQGFREALDDGPVGFWAEDAVEEMVVSLASIEAAWGAGEFRRLSAALETMIDLSDRTGLRDVTAIAHQLREVIATNDSVAIAAVTARLVRVGEASLATLLEISYRLV